MARAVSLSGRLAKPYRFRMADLTPRSSCGNTSSRPNEKIRNIWAVQRPIPFTWMRCSTMPSSDKRPICRRLTVPSFTFRTKSVMYAAFCGDTPTDRNSSTENWASCAAFNPVPTSFRNRAMMEVAAMPEICWEMIEHTSIPKRSRSRPRVNGPTASITAFITGSAARRWRRAFRISVCLNIAYWQSCRPLITCTIAQIVSNSCEFLFSVSRRTTTVLNPSGIPPSSRWSRP
jgi:hypothetical protein